ncbi:MAG TPA: PAS domain S-box protein [Prolixibacteraceae bacterium]|nr:PAS domain S-box protein [Prolixibacteraceae bacterium]
MMNYQSKTKDELIKELQELQQENNSLKALYDKDITERKRANEALRKSEEMYRVLFEESTLGILAADVETHRIIYFNPAICRIFGYLDEEFLRLTIPDLHPKNSLDLMISDFESLMRGEKVISSTIPCLRKDGTVFFVDIAGNPTIINGRKCSVAFFVDVTMRKQAEDALKQANSELQNLHNNLDLAVFSADLINNKMLQVSVAHEAMFGYSQEAFFNNTMLWYEIIVPEDKLIFDASYPVLFSGKNLHHEYRIVHADGQIRWIEAKIKPTLDTNGKLIRIDGIASNITERKRLEETLQESKVKYQAIFENTGTATIIIDEGNTIIMANKECCSITGYTATEIIGQKWNQYFAPESLHKMQKNHQLISQISDLAQKKYEVKLINKQGEIRDVILNIAMISGTKQSIVSILDITEHKRAEQAILQSEENFRRSISESTLGIRMVSADGKTIYANKAFLDIYEFNSLEEFTNTPAINRYTPESYALHQERKEKRKNGHDILDYEISIVRKNAEISHLKVLRKDVMWNGIKHYQVINIDITEQKKLTIDLIAAKEHAEESDRLKSAFLANMSHEIRTPMNGILGFAELLKEPDLTGEEQQEYIQIIEKSGARMLNIINDIVDISTIQSGLMKLNIQDSNINEQIDYIYNFFKPEIEGKGMQFSYKYSYVSGESNIKTDREKLYAILTNLVKNAIKYSKEGSIELGYIKRDETLVFYVKDTGIGIPKDRQVAIFERFIQADIGNRRAYEGAGLGLSIAKAYVEMLGGKIWVESEEGKGSTFYFTLPYNTEHEEKTVVENIVKADVEENQMKKLKILIAEDDESSDKLISIVVWKFGKEIINVATGTKAVEVCRNNSDIDLVLMDIQMPDMDGYEATRQIRQFNKDVVIIAQTAFALTGNREKAIAAGCNDYISKPIKKDELLSLIQKYMNN